MLNYKRYCLLVFYAIHIYCSLEANITVYTHEKFFSIPPGVVNLAIAGFTPHLTAYIKHYGYHQLNIKMLQLSDFLDVLYVKDSYMKLLSTCNNNAVDHLLIAYLPVHFTQIKALLSEKYSECCTLFLNAIVPQIVNLISACAADLNIRYDISLFIPTLTDMNTIPAGTLSSQERNRYLVKELPILDNINTSQLQAITIINNAESCSTEDIIKYLQYEYLYSKSIHYYSIELSKKTFHKYNT